MARRLAAVMIGRAPLEELFSGSDYGQDWVVARDPVRFLVAQALESGALLTAYTAAGHLVAERAAPSLADLRGLLESARRRGLARSVVEVPAGAASAVAWLLEGGADAAS